MAILDADKEGFLRSETSLIQTSGPGRAQSPRPRPLLRRRRDGLDAPGDGRDRAAAGRSRRRTTWSTASSPPRSSSRSTLRSCASSSLDYHDAADRRRRRADVPDAETLRRRIVDLEKAMKAAAKELDFERAAELRDELRGAAGAPDLPVSRFTRSWALET